MLDRRRNKIHRCRDGERNIEMNRYIEKEKEREKERERQRMREIEKDRGKHREGMKLELQGVNVSDRKKKGEGK